MFIVQYIVWHISFSFSLVKSIVIKHLSFWLRKLIRNMFEGQLVQMVKVSLSTSTSEYYMLVLSILVEMIYDAMLSRS